MDIKSPNVCLIGYGYWGKNLLRNLLKFSEASNLCVAELSESKRNSIKALHHNIATYHSFEEALMTEKINAVVIATDTKQHYELAKRALLLNKHVLIEKPITASLREAEELEAIARSKQLILMTDHIYLYHPVIKKIKEYFTEDYLGKLNYIDSTRVNLGIYQNDINVLWDLACHDISIINYFVAEEPTSVRAIGRLNPKYRVEDLAYMFLYYPSGLLVQINSSWASPVKMRKMIFGGEKRMIVYDDVEPINKLVIYDYELNVRLDEDKIELSDYRLGNISIPKVETYEALHQVIAEFYSCIITKAQPLANGKNAIGVVRILEKAQQSINSGGELIYLA
jgi:predicted dehydrogenase